MNQIKTEIHLFRHGETTWNVEGRFQGLEISKLTKRGVLQAQNLGEKNCHCKSWCLYKSIYVLCGSKRNS